MLNILYDGKIFTTQKAGGINRYFSNLITSLPQEYNPVLNTFNIRNVNYPHHPNLKTHYFPLWKPRRLFNWCGENYFSQVTSWKDIDLVHPTYYTFNTKNLLDKKIPIILTVYDMVHELYSEIIPESSEETYFKQKAILSAQQIICISKNTKYDLLSFYPKLDESKIKITYLAHEIDENMAYGSELTPSSPYYIYIGSRASYKNFDRLLLAFSKAISVIPQLKLCVVGSEFNKDEIKLINKLKLSNSIEYYNHVSDSHLAKIYNRSLGLVYPSLYEGFGIPPLEAMACGTVAIASNSSSLPEVVGDAGILFDPQNENELADILIYVHNNSIERERYIEKGYKQAQLFSWEKTVKQTLDVYHSAT